jgi:hypothetical protein
VANVVSRVVEAWQETTIKIPVLPVADSFPQAWEA